MTGVPAGETADDYAGKAGDDGQIFRIFLARY
jgi:hypothetical protein